MKKNFSYKLARYASNIFVPPSFTFLVFLYLSLIVGDEIASPFYIIFQGLILGLVLPIIFFFVLKQKGLVSDLDATIKEERLYPYLFGISLSIIGIVLNLFYGQSLFVSIWQIYLATMILLLIINKIWKISAHAIGVSIPMGLLIYFEGWSSIYYIPMILLICWSRIHLEKHTPLQVVTGSVIGLIVSFTIIQFM